MEKTALSLIHEIAEQLKTIYQHPEEQEQTSWWILEAITKKSEAELMAQSSITLNPNQEEQLQDWIKKHVQEQMPLQYLIGFVPFLNLKIFVEPPVLIPRPETEEWCANLIQQLNKLKNKKIYVLDLCTGSGCIALAIAKAFPSAKIYATDISDEALQLARKNAEHNHISNVTFIESDVYQNIDPTLRFDLIVANPPYISSKEWKLMEPMVTNWEDKQALVAEHDGLAIIEKIIARAPEYLKPNDEMLHYALPQLVIEIGYRQGNQVKDLMYKALFTHVIIRKDLEGKDRIVMGRL